MSYLLYGETVREARKRCGLTQEELAYGICSVSTLSKIENGKRQPHILTFEALMQRMGVSGEGFFLCLSEQEMASCRLLREINRHLWNGDVDYQMPGRGKKIGLFAKPDVLEEQWIGMAGQWCLFRRSIYEYTEFQRESQNFTSFSAVLSDIRSRTLELMRLTLPDCTGHWMAERCFTHCELLGWLLLGFTNAWLGASGVAGELGKELLRYTRGREADRFLSDLQAAVFLLLSRNFQMEENGKDSAGCCSMGVELCLKREKDHMAARWSDVLKSYPAEYREMTGVGTVAGPGELLKE